MSLTGKMSVAEENGYSRYPFQRLTLDLAGTIASNPMLNIEVLSLEGRLKHSFHICG